MTPSIRRHLLTLLLPAVVGIWLISAVISYFDTRGEVDDLLDSQLATSGRVLLAMSLHELLEQRLLGGEGDAMGETVPKKFWELSRPYEKKLVFQVWVNNSILALRSENAPHTPLTKNLEGFSEISFNEENWRIFSIQTDDGLIRVLIGEQVDIRHHLANAIVWRILIPLLISLPLLGLLIWFGINQGMSPLKRITEDMSQRRPGNLSPLNEENVPAEVRPVTQALNNLFAHLKTTLDTERRFTSDAAHELRTPLAALKTHAEVALAAKDSEDQQRALRQVVRGVNRATRLVEQLLTLARLDPETGLASVRRTDIFILAETVISDEAPIAFEKNIEIGLTGTRGKFVNGNPDAIGVLIRNLVDNAIRYTPEGGEVEIMINQNDDTREVILSVADNGPGIPEEDRERVFQRFFRRLGTKSPGSGLGLSIVSRIAELHDARMELATAALGGLQVNVYFHTADSHTPKQALPAKSV